jgi:arginyl-tRNA synthetase
MLRDGLKKEISDAASKLVGEIPDIRLTKPERSENGDWTTNAAFQLAKTLGKNPPDVAEDIALRLRRGQTDLIDRVEAKNGFLNIFVKNEAILKNLDKRISFPKKGEKVNVEFVSANPTGPLTMANGRGGFYGAVLSSVLEKVGYGVTREYYINDAGNQVRLLGESIQAAEGTIPEKEEHYKGDYIKNLKGKSPEEAIQTLLINPELNLIFGFRSKKIRKSHRRGAGHEKKFKNDHECNFCLNEINQLRLLIFGKVDFFSRPLRARRREFKNENSAYSVPLR